MSNYEKQNFVSGQILKAEHMNHIEDGIGTLSEEIAELVDATLIEAGKAADAKVVGDAFNFSTVAGGKNLLDMSKIELDMVFNKSTLQFYYYAGGGQALSDYIYVSAGETVTFFGYNTANPGNYMKQSTRYIVAYTEDNTVIEYVEYKDQYTIAANAVKIRVAFNKQYVEESACAMLTTEPYDSSTIITYEPYYEIPVSGIRVFGKNIVGFAPVDVDTELDVASEKPVANAAVAEAINKLASQGSFCKVDAVCDHYNNETTVVGTEWNGNARAYISAIYAVYDALCESYPNYVTKRESPLNTVDLGDSEDLVDVWCYDFTPPTPYGSGTEPCKIFYCSGTHGGEASPPAIGARFFKDLCDNWKNQDLLRALRWNCKFTVIPMVNPYGFANNTKNNENGVNLNRNFTPGWTSKEASGSSAASETITQAIENMIATEKYDFCLDHHTYGYFNSVPDEFKIGYCCVCSQKSNDVACAEMIGFWADGKVSAETTSLDSTQPYFKQIITSEYAGQMFDAFTHGFCFETMGGWGYDDAGAALEEEYPAQKLAAEVLGTMLYSGFEGFHKY